MPPCSSCGHPLKLPALTLQLGCSSCGTQQSWSPQDQAVKEPAPSQAPECASAATDPAPTDGDKLDAGPTVGLTPKEDADIPIQDRQRLRLREWTPGTFALSSKLIYLGMVLACIACMLTAVGGVVALVGASRWIEEMIFFAVFSASFGMLGICLLCIGRYLRMLARFQEEFWQRGRALLLAARGDGDYATPRPNIESFVAHGRVLAIFGAASGAWLGMLGLVGCGIGLSESRWLEEVIFSFGAFFAGCVGGCFVFCLAAYCHQQVLGFLELVRDQDALLTELELRTASPA